MKKVVLHGDLAKHLPDGEFVCYFNTVREAISAIEVNYPGLFELLADKYVQVLPGNREELALGVEQITSWNINSDELHIVPVLEGSGGGGGTNSNRSKGVKAILGLALIAVAIVGTGGLAGIAGGSLQGAVFGNSFGITGMQLLQFGGALVMSAFAPAPPSVDAADRVKNTTFTGPLNTNREGSVLPYIAGTRVIVGGVVINTELVVGN